MLGDRAGVPPGTPQPRAVYIGQAAIGGGDEESAARRPHWSASAQRCNQARSVPGDGSRIQEGSGRSVTVRSSETTADGCRISGGPGLDETHLQAEEGPGQLQRWGSEPGSVASTEGGGAWEADDRGRHGSALRSGAPSTRPQSEIAERSSPAADAVTVAVQGDRARLSRGCTDGQTQQTVRDRPVAAALNLIKRVSVISKGTRHYSVVKRKSKNWCKIN
ncbi:Lamina-associated polypeptide 2, isoforms beta/delta/epsilon/gamma [Frankliniella fusca]|uniref:Lamina-associated polypeptide 2, isoforms beta/delta/epsilon/gamma n=1 Tax=Frankliniella fusca TaxID=407009 RepID=A0AAE1HAZ2_9NEOP|nr:Lamina-associated polypeptide 2, isoforms beta/delta/epsilon/gamma [Frankliniella fusca]